MKTARQQLTAKIEERDTATLIELAHELNLKTSTEEMLVSCEISNVLEARLSPADFVELMYILEEELIAA